MGLDIHAASHLRFLRPMPENEDLDRLETEALQQGKCFDEAYFLLFPNDPSHRRQLAGTEPGLYEYSPASEQHRFRVGAYSEYGRWRTLLSRCMLGAPAEAIWDAKKRNSGRPFVELVDFTDCDGGIGTRVARKLAADFQAHAAQAKEFASSLGEEGSNWLEVYQEFAKAFELAAQDGALAFC